MNTADQRPVQILSPEEENEEQCNNNFLLSKGKKPKQVRLSQQNRKDYLDAIAKVFDQSPILSLEVMNNNALEKGQVLQINPYGLENSLRNAQDGYTYFGFEKDPKEKTNDDIPGIDYVIQPKETNYEAKYIGLHFQVYFNPIDMKYYMNDLGYGFGTFMKITSDIKIKENSLINIGNSYLVFTYENEDITTKQPLNSISLQTVVTEKLNRTLTLKIFSGNGKYDPFVFPPNCHSPLYIGRDSECSVMIDDQLLSRYHCTIEYKADKGWVINDGKVKGRDIKLSTNGTWLYLIEDTIIYDGMIFKGNQNLFKCRYIDSH